MSSDEIELKEFLANPDILDNIIKECVEDLPDGLRFLTFPKYADIQYVWHQCHENLQKHFNFKLNLGDIVFDLGSHHGILALNSAYMGAKVIAYEPHPINVAVLKRNVALNPALNIQVHEKAVYSSAGIMDFNLGETLTTGALSKVGRDWKRTDQDISVECINFEDLLEKHGSNDIKLMKVNCEGSEYDFLMKTEPQLLRKVQYYYIDVHPTQFRAHDELKAFLEGVGYEVVEISTVHGCYDQACRRID